MNPKYLIRNGPFVLFLILVACAPAATPPPSVTPTATLPVRTNTPLPVPSPTPTPVPSQSKAILIGLLQEREPDTLWPLGNVTEEQRMVLAAVMEPPMTTLGYDYQPVLFERIPLLENGDAVITRTQVPLDPLTGAITTTDTGVYTWTPQLQVTFHLRADLYWSDGQPVKASDSVFGFNVACAPESGNAGYRRCDKIADYRALDARTLRVTFKPAVMELDYFTYYWPFMPEHAWSHYTVREMSTAEQVARRLSPSYGPYMVEDWTPGQSITLVRNPYYVFHGKNYPLVGKIIFKFVPTSYDLLSQLLAGQIDLVDSRGLQGLDPALLRALEENGLLRFYSQPALLWENIVFNLNDPADLSQPHPVLSDPRVRQAIAYGINRQAIAEQLYQEPVPLMHSWIPSDHWAYPGDEALTLYPYKPISATVLLEEAGWILADDGYRYKDGNRLQLKLYILAGQPMRETIAQQVQAALEPLGMAIEIVRVREEEWFGSEQSPLTRRTFDLIEFAWAAGLEPDGQSVYTCGEIPTADNGWHGQNYSGWCNSAATAALLAAAQELRRDARVELYRIAQEQFTAELPALPLFSRRQYYAAAPALANLQLDPTETTTWNCWEWSLPARR